jgi:putative membrane protein
MGFVVRCSGRMEYANSILWALIMGYVITRVREYVAFPLGAALGILAAFTLFALVLANVRARIRYVEVKGEGLSVHKGLFNKKVMFIPYARITNLRVNRGIMERIFGLGSLEIDTAGTGIVEVYMGGIPSGQLERLNEAVQGKGRGV